MSDHIKPLSSIVNDWRSTFGLCEYESLAYSIVNFLRSDTPSKHHLLKIEGGYDKGAGWEKRFVIEDVTYDPAIFAAMASQGYFEHQCFPKWCFVVTQKFIERCPTATYEEREEQRKASIA